LNRKFAKQFLYAVAVVAMAGAVFAQGARPASDKLRTRKLIGLGKRARVYTPSFSTDVGRGINAAKEWHAVTVTYDTAPEWIDELLIQFYVLGIMKSPETGRNTYSLYKTAVRYIDIEKGRNHTAVAFLRPAAIKRYGDPIAVAAVFTLDGEVVAELSDESTQLPEKWWRNPLVTDSKDVIVRDGYLMDRSKTPWAVINSDDYEVIK
jgi:hypothetical protein